jgi:hypothetical protein
MPKSIDQEIKETENKLKKLLNLKKRQNQLTTVVQKKKPPKNQPKKQHKITTPKKKRNITTPKKMKVIPTEEIRPGVYRRIDPEAMRIIRNVTFKFHGDKHKANILHQSEMFNYVSSRVGLKNKREGTSIVALWKDYIERLENEGQKMTPKKFWGDVNVTKDGNKDTVSIASFNIPPLNIPERSKQWTEKDERMYLLAELLNATEYEYNGLSANAIDITGIVRFQSYDANLKSPLKEVKMKGLRNFYKHIEDVNTKSSTSIVSNHEDECVIDYIWAETKGRKRFQSFSREKLVKEFMSVCNNNIADGITTAQIIEWASRFHHK